MDRPLPLSSATLPHLPPVVAAPAYDRARLLPGVVHLGAGAFHRSHQAVVLDDLAALGDLRWGVVATGFRTRRTHEVLTEQDGLFTVVERGADADRARVVGSVVRSLHGGDDPDAVADAIADPCCSLVTVTVTAGGYDDPRAPAWRALVEGLRRRGDRPLTVLSCDNLLDNGRMARAVVLDAAKGDHALRTRIEEHVAFPSSMVDRITPQTTPADRRWVAEAFGVRDRWPVLTEPTWQWVIEDAFAEGTRPPLELVGVQLVPDVRPHVLAKTRMLNGGHLALGALGALAGLERLDEVLTDPVLAEYADRFLAEVGAVLGDIEGLDLDLYRASLLERFANPKLADRLDRLGRQGTKKAMQHLLPTLRTARLVGLPDEHLVLALAGWARCLRGRDDLGRRMAFDQPGTWRDLQIALGHDRAVWRALRALERDGVHATVESLLSHDRPLAA